MFRSKTNKSKSFLNDTDTCVLDFRNICPRFACLLLWLLDLLVGMTLAGLLEASMVDIPFSHTLSHKEL